VHDEADLIPLALYLSGASRPAVTLIEERSPKMMRRMPLLPQRRNTAYLKPLKGTARGLEGTCD
jgi:hypothetical protein